MWRLNIAAYFHFQLYCFVSSHSAMTVLIAMKGFESEMLFPKIYGDADCGITLARSTLTFSAPGMLSGTDWACAPGLHPRSNITRLFLIGTAKPSTLGGKVGRSASEPRAGPWIAALIRNNRPSY